MNWLMMQPVSVTLLVVSMGLMAMAELLRSIKQSDCGHPLNELLEGMVYHKEDFKPKHVLLREKGDRDKMFYSIDKLNREKLPESFLVVKKTRTGYQIRPYTPSNSAYDIQIG